MNKTTVKSKWKKMPIETTIWGTGGGNYILEEDGVEAHISYQPWTSNPDDLDMIDSLVTLATGDDSKRVHETALYDGRDDVWMILKGDFRKEYEQLYPDIDKCIDFYKEMKPDHGYDKWSTDNV